MTSPFRFGSAAVSAKLDGGVAAATTALSLGEHDFVATYSGDAAFRGASATMKQQVGPASTSTSLATTPNPSAGDQPVALVASVSSPSPWLAGGAVEFFRSGELLGSASLGSNGVAVLNGMRLPAGTSELLARYTGTEFFAPSTSETTSHVTQPPAVGAYSQVAMPGLRAMSASVADVTGDGVDDVVVSARGDGKPGSGDLVMLYAGQPAGAGLATPVPVATSEPTAGVLRIATGDFDSDGTADVATASDAGVTAHFRDASSASWFGTSVPVSDTPARDVAVADVTRDGRADVVVAARGGGIRVFDSVGGREFDTGREVTAAVHDLVAAGDVTGDGLVDVLGHAPGAVTVYAQGTDGTFAQRSVVTFPAATSAFTLVDANTDGKLDIAATAPGRDFTEKPSMFVVPQLVGGKLGEPNYHPSAASPQALLAADVTGDTRHDVVTAHAGIGRVGVFAQLSAHDGYFQQETVEVPVSSSYDARALAAGQLDGTGGLDVVVAAGEQGLLLLAGTAG